MESDLKVYAVTCKGCGREFGTTMERVTICRECENFKTFLEDLMQQKPKPQKRNDLISGFIIGIFAMAAVLAGFSLVFRWLQ